jgi:hypothetical protein
MSFGFFITPEPSRRMTQPLSEKTIKALQEITREEYGREITFAEATELAAQLVGYFDVLAKIYHREKTENPEVPMTQ